MTRESARRGPALLAGLLLFGLAAFSQFVAATYGEGPAPPPLRLEDVPEADRARVRIHDSVPVLRLSGTPYEMGRQHGAILKAQIHFLHREYYQAMIERAVSKEEAARWAESVAEYIPEAYREEMRGLADGCGLPYEEVLRVNAMVDRFQTMFCSTVVAAGDAAGGEVIFGRNLDFPGRNILQRTTVVLVWHPAEGTPLAAVTWPGLVGVLSGMNGHGVAGATMMIHGRQRQPGVPYPLMYRAALEGAHATADVRKAIAGTRRTCPNNFMVVDATGAAEVVEYDVDRVLAVPAAGGCACSTNFFQSEELEEVVVARIGLDRYDALREFLARERGKIDVESVRRALVDVAEPWYMNVQSMIFLPARGELHVAKGADKPPAARQPFVRIAREDLFGTEPAKR